MTFAELKALRKSRGMSYGDGQVHRWLIAERKEGRITKIDGYYRQADGTKERKVYYIVK